MDKEMDKPMPLIHPKRMQKSTRFQSRIRFCFIFFSIHFNHLLFMRNTVPRPAYYWPARRGPLREEKKKAGWRIPLEKKSRPFYARTARDDDDDHACAHATATHARSLFPPAS
jgi:hypothetical protein